MKKSLSAILAASMAFSMFASAAFAADPALDTEGKFQAMKEAGIFQGYPDGKSHLEANMTRAEFAKALAALLGLEDDAAAAKVYSDVAANHWAIGEIGALTAEEIMNGTGAGKFGPKVNVSIEQLAKIVVGAMGLEPKEDAEVEGKTSVWATGYVAAAVEAGLIAKSADYTVLANRGDLVDASYTVFEQGQVSVKEVKVIDEKNIEVVFTDGKSVKKTLDTALVEGAETTVSVEYEGKKYDVKVTLKALAAEIAATGAQKFEVKFNRAVDPAKAKVEVKKNGTEVKTDSVKFSEDKTSATVVLSSKFFAGDYEVTVSGLTTDPIKSTIKAENEKIAKVEFLSDKLAVNDTLDTAIVSYKVTNQYEEDITQTTSGINWTASTGTGTATASNGAVRVTLSGGAKFQIGQTVIVSGVHSSSNAYVSGTLTVGQVAMVDTVEIKGLYSADKKELSTASNFGEYYILVSAKDQYGNAVNAKKFNDDTVVMASNQAIFQTGAAVDGVGPEGKDIGIPLVNGLGISLDGTNTVTIVSKINVKTVKIDVPVKKAAGLDTFELRSPAQAVSVGQTVDIPFAAADQYGTAIEKFNDLNTKVTFNPPAKVTLVQDYKTGKGVVKFDTTGLQVGSYTILAITNTGKTSQVNIDVKAAATPATISGTKDIALNFVKGAEQTVKEGNFVIKDQHGRDFTTDANFFDTYAIKLTAVDGAFDKVVVPNPSTYVADDSALLFKASATQAGVERVRAEIVTKDTGVALSGSAYEFNINVLDKADVSEYVVGDLGKLYVATSHDKAVDVSGKKADGSKIILPSNMITIVPSGKLSLASGKLSANGAVIGANADDAITEETANFSVIVDAADKPVRVEKTVTISDVAPKIESISAASVTGGVQVDGNLLTGTVSADKLFAALTFKDQYGVDLTGADSAVRFTVTNQTGTVTVGGTGNGTLASGIEITASAGSTFNLTVDSVATGKSAEFKVVAN